MKENVIFVRPPKIAGSSIAQSLGLSGYRFARHLRIDPPTSGWIHFSHMHVPALVEAGLVSEEYYNSAFKFSFVRNPYDRLVSMFHYYKQWKLKKPSGEVVQRWEAGIETFLDWCRHIDSGPIPPLGTYSIWHNKQHIQSGFNPQCYWFKDVELDFLGRFESIDEDYEKLSGILGIPYVKLLRLRTTTHKHYEKYLCPESIEILNRIYGEDFEQLNYTLHN